MGTQYPSRLFGITSSHCRSLILFATSWPLVLHAEWHYAPRENLTFTGRVSAGVAGVTTPGTNLGTGRVNPRTGISEGDATWGEAFVMPAIAAEAGAWYGEISAVGAITAGDGDPGGYTRGGDGEFDLETAFIGWRSGDPAADKDQPVVDISLGRQALNIGDGFLIDDGNLDSGDNGGVWLVARQAFQRTVLARIDYRALHTDLFFLEADPDNDEPAFAGANLEYQFETTGHLGLLYFHILDADAPTVFSPRQGMNVMSARVNDLRMPFAPELALWGEATRQTGVGRDAQFDASAWYGELIYHFETLPWTPSLSYRYAYFSGDPNSSDFTRRDFDPLFYGFDQRGWGTWFQGEVIGGWLLFNNNQRNHLVHLAMTPHDALTMGLIGGTFSLAESNYLGTPVTARHFGDELDVYANWFVRENVLVSAAYGVMFPGEAAIQAFGDDEKFHVIEVGIYFNF